MASVNLFSLMGKIAVDGVEQTTKDLEDVSKTGKDTEGKLNTNFTSIANKAGELGKKAAIGLAGIATAATALVESTKEFRQDWGKLETTFKVTNQEVGVAEQTFKTLFGVLGEDDTSIEAANHLAMLTNNEKDLNQWTDILTGVYATFGDSLPLEGLAEAANETMRVGQVTGPLADALNWAGVSEDAFNEKLEKCTSNQEREALIRETLNGLYNEASTEYQKTNESVIANNQAQAELNMKMAEMAEKLEPLITKGKMFLLEVLEKISPALQWAIDNMNILAPIVMTFVGGLLAMGIAGKIASFINTIKTLQTAFAALNITMSLNPIGLVIAAVVALIAIFATLWVKCEGFRNFVTEWFNKIVDFVKNNWQDMLLMLVNPFAGAFNMLYNNCEGFRNFIDKWVNIIKNFFKENWEALLLMLVNPFAGAFKLLYDNCEGFRNFVDKWVKIIKDFFVNGFNNIKDKVVSTFTNLKNSAVNIVTSIKDGIVDRFNSLKNSVTTIFNNVKNAITKPIETARDIIRGIVDKIKGFFKFTISIPKIKLPHFTIKPSGWKVGDLLKGSIPKLGIDWYAKAMNNPMLLEDPTAFGFSSSGNIRVGGEAGDEIVGGANTIMNMIGEAVSNNNGGMEEKLDKLISLLSKYLPAMQNQQVVLSTGELVGALTNPLDKSLGELTESRRRGR